MAWVCNNLLHSGPCNGSCHLRNHCIRQGWSVGTGTDHGIWIDPPGVDKDLKALDATHDVDPNSHDMAGEATDARVAGSKPFKILNAVKAWIMAACTDSIQIGPEDFGCASHGPPYDEQNHNCLYEIENGATSSQLYCWDQNEAEDDKVVVVAPHASRRQVAFHANDALAYSNALCWGKLHNAPGGGRAYDIAEWPIWNYLGMKYERLQWNVGPPVYRYLVNRALDWFSEPANARQIGCDLVENANGQNWQHGTWDHWSRFWDPLAGGDCQDAPVVAVLQMETVPGGCKYEAALILIAVQVEVWMSMWFQGASDKSVGPTAVVKISGQFGLRRQWIDPPCKITVDHLRWQNKAPGSDIDVDFASGQVGAGGEDCQRIDTGEAGFSDPRVRGRVTGIQGVSAASVLQDLARGNAVIPAGFCWYGFRGATKLSSPRWQAIYDGEHAGSGPDYCCCLCDAMRDYQVGPYQTRPGESAAAQAWSGSVYLDCPSGGALFDGWCSSRLEEISCSNSGLPLPSEP